MIYNDETLSFSVLNAGVYKHKNGSFEATPRSYAALSYRLSGSAVFKIKGESYKIETGDILFLPAGIPYTVSYTDSESLVIHLDHLNYTDVDKIVVNNKSELLALFREVCDGEKEAPSQNRMKSRVYGILSAIEEDAKLKNQRGEISKCIEYIRESFTDPALTVERICRESFVSHSTLQRAFLKALGTTPKEYIIKLRLKHSLELLLSGEVSCKEAAFLSGFSDEKYFSRLFKRHYSVSPSSFLGGHK